MFGNAEGFPGALCSHRISAGTVGLLENYSGDGGLGKIINVFTFIPQLQRLCTSASPRICTDHPGKTWGGGGIPAQASVFSRKIHSWEKF